MQANNARAGGPGSTNNQHLARPADVLITGAQLRDDQQQLAVGSSVSVKFLRGGLDAVVGL